MGANRMAPWAPIGRCRKRDGPSSISRAGSGSRPSLLWPRASTITFRRTCSCRCRRRRPTGSPSFAILTDPLPHDLLVAGPERAQPLRRDRPGRHQLDRHSQGCRARSDSVRTAREGEREIPTDLPERELTRGWLKASNRALDPARSKPWKPWHKLTRAGAAKGDAGQDRRICDRDLLDGQSVPQRPSHLRRNHQPRSADRRCSAPPMSNIFPITSARSRTVVHQHLSRRGPSLAPVAPGHPDGVIKCSGFEAAACARGDSWICISTTRSC